MVEFLHFFFLCKMDALLHHSLCNVTCVSSFLLSMTYRIGRSKPGKTQLFILQCNLHCAVNHQDAVVRVGTIHVLCSTHTLLGCQVWDLSVYSFQLASFYNYIQVFKGPLQLKENMY